MKSLTFKTKILLLVIMPLVILSTMLTILAIYQANELGKSNIASFETKINELRRKELKNYIEIAMSAVEHIYQHEYADFGDQQDAQERAKEIFRNLAYGKDGYFFVYNYDAVNLVHPKKPTLEGRNLWDLADENGVLLIQEFIGNARNGGGYTDYTWEKPSLGRTVGKVGYSSTLDNWGWMIGTGLYVDDLNESVERVSEQVDNNITHTLTLIGLVALVGTLLVGIIGARFTMSEGKLADDKLQHLSRKNVEVQEAERSRVARQLQSGINQALVASRAKLQKVAKARSFTEAGTRREFVEAVSILNKTIKEVYRISGELRPSMLDKMGLYSAIEALTEEISRKSGIVIVVDNAEAQERLRPEMETAVYRIVQETLKNIEVHSKATEASINLRQAPTLLTLSIKDNGVGFNTKTVLGGGNKAGIGLIDMRVRAESLGGTFTVLSSKKTGTTVSVEIPL